MIILTRLILKLLNSLPRKKEKLLRLPAPKGQEEKKKKLPSFLWKLFLGNLLFAMLLLAFETAAIGYGIYQYFLRVLPAPTEEAMFAMPESIKIYDRNGVFLYEFHGDKKRRFVPLKEIPDYLKKATIAIEDKNFYRHHGYDPIAMARAFYVNYRNEGISQGASTITQQLARTMFLDQEKAYIRKVKELVLAIEIEKRYTKDQILEMYLNNIPYGGIAYGISAAAEIYLDKPVNKLSLKEAAYLAALPKAPTDYSPFGNNKAGLDRRAEEVVSAMQANGYLGPEEASQAIGEPRPHFKTKPAYIKAPHFVFYVIDEFRKKYGDKALRQGGFDIYTTLDMSLQRKAEAVIDKWGPINEKKYKATNAALTAVDPSKGEILAMVGSRNFFDPRNGSFNVAVSPRQPGSSFKPYVYATAFSKIGLTPDTTIVDSRTNFASANYGVDYIPRNYSGGYYGTVTVRKALAGSLNIPAVKTLVKTGIGRVLDQAQAMGLSTLGDRKRFGPSLALGGGEVKLLEHTAAMGIFGNGGKKQELSPILRIKKRDGTVVYEKKPEAGKQVVDARAAYWISDILSDSKARQYIFGRSGKLDIPGNRVAVKTGTTQDWHDAWTVGFTPSIAVGVWSGNNDNRTMAKGADGSFVAAPIWKDFMTYALTKVARKDFVKPAGIDKILAEKKPLIGNSAKKPALETGGAGKSVGKADKKPELTLVSEEKKNERDLLLLDQGYLIGGHAFVKLGP